MKQRAFPDWLLGVSFAATWTWAAAMLVGISILRDAGIMPFALWFVANAAAIPVFGWASRRWPDLWDQTRRPLMRGLMSVMLLFTLWFNMSGIRDVTMPMFADFRWAYFLPVLALGAVWLFTFYGGIRWSVVSDRVQWALELGAVVVMVALVMWERGGFVVQPGLQWGSYTDVRGWVFGLWTVPLLLSNPFLDGTFWHRAAYADSMRPYWWGFGMFLAYLCGVAAIAVMGLTPGASAVLFVAIFFASFSTLDSCTAALQLTAGRTIGNALGVLAIPAWYMVANVGLLDIWVLFFAWYPALFAIQVATLWLQRRGVMAPPAAATLAARDAVPLIVDEQATAGAVSP